MSEDDYNSLVSLTLSGARGIRNDPNFKNELMKQDLLSLSNRILDYDCSSRSPEADPMQYFRK